MHSPFVFDFIVNVLNDKRSFYAFNEIELHNHLPSSIEKKYGELLFKMINYYQPQSISIIEANPSKTTAYAANANKEIQVNYLTNDALAAENLFKPFRLQNIKYISPGQLQHYLKYGCFIVIDSIVSDAFLQTLINNSTNSTIFIISNIHVNKEMEMLWQQMQLNEKITACINLFAMGVALINTDFKVKQNFKVRY